MATVRLTDAVKRDIAHSIERQYQKRMKVATTEGQTAGGLFDGNALYETVFVTHIPELAKLNADTRKHYCKHSGHILVRTVEVFTDTAQTHSMKRIDIPEHLGKMPIYTERPIPLTDFNETTALQGGGSATVSLQSNYYGPTMSIRVAGLDTIPETNQYAKLARWAMQITAHEEVTALDKERKEAIEKVGELLGRFATLAPALKAFPTLWELLDDHVKERHKQVVERKNSRSASTESLPDMSDITATIITNKLGGT